MSEPSTPTGGAIPSPLWTENQRQAAVIAELRAELDAERARAEKWRNETYAALGRAAALENALLRLTIAGITAHGGSWAEARIEEALGDE